MVILPTYHPSYINRMRYSKGDVGTNLKYVWLADLTKARRLTHGYTPPTENFTLFPTFDEVTERLRWMIETRPLIAVDIETTALDPSKGNIVVIGLAWSPSDALSIPFLSQGGRRVWSDAQQAYLNRAITEVLSACPQAYQNALYDVRWLRAKGYAPNLALIRHDTLLLHHAISPELPHNLGFIVSTYGTTPYWKASFRERPGRILDMDDEELRRYNLRDTVVLHQVLPGMLEDLQEMATSPIYTDESVPLISPVLKMIERGIKLSPTRLKKWKGSLETELLATEGELRSTTGVPEGFNFASDEDLRWLLLSVPSTKFAKLSDLPTKKPGTKIHAQLVALKAIHETPTFAKVAGFTGRRTDTGKYAVDKQGLLSLQLAVQNRLASVLKFVKQENFVDERASLEKLLTTLTLIRDHRRVSKLLSVYTSFPLIEGRVHSSFMIHGTATGRLSSSSPNLQTLPIKTYPELGRCFVAEKGSVFLQADYSNLEVRLLAYETNDIPLIDFIESGGNFHDENTRRMFGINEGHPNWIVSRRAAKTFAFGGLAYGGGDREIYEKVVLQAPELALTFAAFTAAKDRWMVAHPAYVAWREATTDQAVGTRRVSNAFGRVRVLHGSQRDIVKEALNFPIQSAGASIINRATIAIDKALPPGAYLVCQIHDALLFEVPLTKLAETATLITTEMTRAVDFRGTLRSFPIDLEVGPDWGSLKEYKL